jgi:hypothetical protein
MANDTAGLVLGALLTGGVSVAGGWMAWRGWRRARVVEDTPLAKIDSAAQGDVHLEGRARPLNGKPTLCPLTGTPCLWYAYRVERYQRSGKNSRWVTVAQGRSLDLFGLEDETGKAVVHPARAEVIPARRRVWRGHSPSPLAEPTGFFGALFAPSYRYTEELIVPEETLRVLGWFQSLDGTVRGPSVNERLRALKADAATLLARFDTDRDGQISVEEWDAARAVVEAEAREAALRAPAGPVVHTVTLSPESGHPFVISALPAAALARRYRWSAFGAALAFLAALTATAWLVRALLAGVPAVLP